MVHIKHCKSLFFTETNWRKISDLAWRYLDYKSELCYILLNLAWKSFGQQFIITLMSYFTGAGLENTWTMSLDHTSTEFGLENTWVTDLDFDCYFILPDLNLKIPGHYKFGLRLLDFTGFRLGNMWTYLSSVEVRGLRWFFYQTLNKRFVSPWFK